MRATRPLWFLLVGVCVGGAALPPKPKVSGLAVTRYVQGTALWVKGCWTASGSPDSILTGLTGPQTLNHRIKGTATCDSFSVARPSAAQTVGGAFTARAKRRTLMSNTVSKAWTYTEPDSPPPDPVIDSLMVRPASFTVEATIPGVPPTAKNMQAVCALVGFRSGHVGFRRVYEGGIAYCDSTYRALPAAVRAVSVAEQAMADATCIDWSRSTGGSVTPELCGPNPAVRFAPDARWGSAEVTITPPAVTPRAQNSGQT